MATSPAPCHPHSALPGAGITSQVQALLPAWASHLFSLKHIHPSPPLCRYYFSSNVGLAAAHLTRVIKYVQREFPYWNRTRGADHFFFNTQVTFSGEPPVVGRLPLMFQASQCLLALLPAPVDNANK